MNVKGHSHFLKKRSPENENASYFTEIVFPEISPTIGNGAPVIFVSVRRPLVPDDENNPFTLSLQLSTGLWFIGHKIGSSIIIIRRSRISQRYP